MKRALNPRLGAVIVASALLISLKLVAAQQGGSGSVADVYLYDQPETSSREQDRDNKAFRDGLILLHSLLRRHHIFSSSADSWSSVFKSWKASGL